MTDRPLTEQELEKVRAETIKAGAEARKALAEAEKIEAEAAFEHLKLDREKEKRANELVDDEQFHVYRFTSSVDASSSRACMAVLARWSRLSQAGINFWNEDSEGDEPSPCAMEIIFTSPGGDVLNGMALFDFIQEIKRKGHVVTTKALGYAASMAGILLQAGNERVMSRESWLLIHRGSASVTGDMAKIDDYTEWFRRIDDRILDIFYERSRGAPKSLSRKALSKKFERKDWWLSSEEALEHGFCDRLE